MTLASSESPSVLFPGHFSRAFLAGECLSLCSRVLYCTACKNRGVSSCAVLGPPAVSTGPTRGRPRGEHVEGRGGTNTPSPRFPDLHLVREATGPSEDAVILKRLPTDWASVTCQPGLSTFGSCTVRDTPAHGSCPCLTQDDPETHSWDMAGPGLEPGAAAYEGVHLSGKKYFGLSSQERD